jgi:eukaryotic-like serine/threonine-protein kinase
MTMTSDDGFFGRLGEAVTGWRSAPRSRQGSVVSGYRIGVPLGEGYYGTVYEATRVDDDDTRVAIKFLEGSRQRVAAGSDAYVETAAASKLNHLDITKLLDVGVTFDGAVYLVMELVRGERLDEFCRRHDLPVLERLDLFERLCRAVHHAHQQGVLHLDLKPANILITAGGAPKLLDFGVSQILDELPRPGGRVPARRFRGFTPNYAGPEQFNGLQPTRMSDVYSLGVILYQLVSDVLPLEVEDVAPPVRAEFVDNTVPRPASVAARGALLAQCRRGLRRDIDAIVLLALRKRPEERYATAQQLADDVRGARDGMAIRARPRSPIVRAVRVVRRHPIGAAAVALYLVLAVAGVSRAQQRLVQLQSVRSDGRAQVEVARELQGVGFTFLDGLSGLSNVTEARLLLADRLASSLDRLSAAAAYTDPRLDHELAGDYERLFKRYRDLQSPQQALAALEAGIYAHERTDWMFEGASERLARLALLEEALNLCRSLDECAPQGSIDREIARLRGGQP